MGVISDFINYLRFTDGIATSDIIGWGLGALAGIVAYKLIDHMQTSIERHSMVASIEDGFSGLFDMPIAISDAPHTELTEKDVEDRKVMVRSVLNDDTPWETVRCKDDPSRLEMHIISNQRYMHIRDNDKRSDWISTQALHELCLKCRRIEKLYKDGVMKRIDLADMFREIVPLGASGRMEYISAYYDDFDADCLGYIVMQTVVSCDKCKNDSDYLKYFSYYYTTHPDIHRYFVEGTRIRKIRDFLAVRRFERIVKNRSERYNKND